MSVDGNQSQSFDQTTLEYHGDEVAVIGVALRVPGANDPWTFWENLLQGKESFDALSDEELKAAGVPQSLLENPRFVKIKAALNKIGDFDPRFFGLSPFDATLMDPQYRHFLELAWEGLESAGEDPKKFNGTIGVYGGSGQNNYLIHHLLSQKKLVQNPGPWYLRHVGNDKDFMTTRASYHLDLTGPSVNVQTACSTSLVAIHMAAQALIARECDMALAGGVTIEFPHGKGYLAPENGIEDPQGHCRSFDAASQGTVFSSGGGVVVLKRLENAIANGDHILAVVKASALSNDGAQKAGYTAPSVDGQVAAILEALDLGEIDPETIGYVEGHGTGTPIGDPIEVQALTTAWGSTTQKKQFAAISSVKSNIGHLDTAAGVVSFIKAVGAVYHGVKYPTVHFQKANPALEIENTPFYLSNTAEKWVSQYPRRAAVSSLGVGGTNAHVILEQPPQQKKKSDQVKTDFIIPLSAKSPQSLQAYQHKLKNFLMATRDAAEHNKSLIKNTMTNISMANIVKTLESRRAFEYRAVISASSIDECIEALSSGHHTAFGMHKATETHPQKIAFAFTGQGTQYFNMGRQLYEANADYRRAFDECAEIVLPFFKHDIRKIIFIDNPDQTQQDFLDRIDVTHPVLFSIGYALAQAWMAKGIRPHAMIGHSLGEYVAATLAGVFELPDVLKLMCERGRLMQSTPRGVMLSIAADEQDILPFLQSADLQGKLSIAGVNVKGMCVVAGYPAAGDILIPRLEAKDISVKPLRIPRASHSVLMDSILNEFENAVAQCKMKPANLPIVSNINGQWLQPSDSTQPAYWREHLRSAVRFADGADTLMQDPEGYLFIEMGPGSQLARLLEAHPSRGDRHAVINSMPGPKDEIDSAVWFKLGPGRAWAVGARPTPGNPDLSGVPKVILPTYAWDHQFLMIEQAQNNFANVQDDSLEKQPFEQWFSVPGWKREILHKLKAVPAGKEQNHLKNHKPLALLMTDYLSETVAQFVSYLENHVQVIIVFRGDTQEVFESPAGTAYRVNALEETGIEWLFEQLESSFPQLSEQLVSVIEWIEPQALAGTMETAGNMETDVSTNTASRIRQYFHQVFLTAKKLSTYSWNQLTYSALGQGLLGHSPTDIDDPMKVLIQGPLRALAAENAQVQCRFIDYDNASLKNRQFLPRVVDEVLNLNASSNQTSGWDEVAYRGAKRYVRTYDLQSMPESTASFQSKMRMHGHYLIVGLGDLAIVAAEYIVNDWQGVPIFVTRSAFPACSQWQQIAASPRIDQTAQRIRALLKLREKIPQLEIMRADVTHAPSMKKVMERIRSTHGQINGIFHTAGVIDDQLLSMKSLKSAERVLAPKVSGIAYLEPLLKTESLDFVLLFSSISSLLGLAGQADYAAANGFLGSWARVQNQHYGRPVCAIHWGAWSEVGMAVQAAQAQGLKSQVYDFPVNQLKACHLIAGPKGAEYQCYGLFSTQHWVLDHHRTNKGQAIMPGTGMLDLLANSFVHITGEHSFELSGLTFQAPVAVQNQKPALLAVNMRKSTRDKPNKDTYGFEGLEYQMELVSGLSIEKLQKHEVQQRHAAVTVRSLQRQPVPEPVDIDALREGWSYVTYKSNTHPHIRFGARWQVLPEAWLGTHEALLHLKLPEHFHGDLLQHPWHPGVLDLAIGSKDLLSINPETDFYVPMFYEKIRIYGPVKTECYSHVRLTSSHQSPDVAVFDVRILDTNGQCLLDIEGFHLKKAPLSVLDVTPLDGVENEVELIKSLLQETQLKSAATNDDADLFAISLANGIKPLEGQKALSHILQFDSLPSQIVVSPMPLRAIKAGDTVKVVETTHLLPRPTLSVPFDAPRTDLENVIASIWSQALGLDSIGRDDQFFELGGHSLLLIQIIAKLKKKVSVNVPMSTLFDASTIAQWAEAIGDVPDLFDEETDNANTHTASNHSDPYQKGADVKFPDIKTNLENTSEHQTKSVSRVERRGLLTPEVV